MKMAFSVSFGRKPVAGTQAKTLLKNMIRHTDTHNRLLEEAEMWNMHTKDKEGRSSNREKDERRAGRRRDGSSEASAHRRESSNIKNSFLYDDRETTGDWSSSGRRGARRAHMDDDYINDNDTHSNKRDESTFWMRQMFKAEAGDDDRWGHTGYKELYPQDFDSGRSGNGSETEDDSSSSSESDDSDTKRRKKKRKKSSSREVHRKSKRRKEKKKRGGMKRKKKDKDELSSEDEESEIEKEKSRRKKKKREKDRKRKRTKKMSNEDESGSDVDQKRKRRRK